MVNIHSKRIEHTMVKRFVNLKGPLVNIGDTLVGIFKEEGIHLIDIQPTGLRKLIAYDFQYEVPIQWSPYREGRKDIRPWKDLTKSDLIEELLEAKFDNFIVEVDPGTTAAPVNDDKDWYVEACVYFIPKSPSSS